MVTVKGRCFALHPEFVSSVISCVCLDEGKLLFHCCELVHAICFDSGLIEFSLLFRFLLVIFKYMAAYCKGSAYAEQKEVRGRIQAKVSEQSGL